MGNHAIFGGGGSSDELKGACPSSFPSSVAKERGCGWCWFGCEKCRTVCDLPDNVYAFRSSAAKSPGGMKTGDAIDEPLGYEFCASSLKPGGEDYWPNNNKGSTDYAMNGGNDKCWTSYLCINGGCEPTSRFDGCFNANGVFRVESQQDSLSEDFTECLGTDMSFNSNGAPPVLGHGTETRSDTIAADMGIVGGLACVGFFANRMRQNRLKKAPNQAELSMVNSNGGV